MAKRKNSDQNVDEGGQPEVNGHVDNLVQRDVPDNTSAATEEKLSEVQGQEPSPEQELEIDRITAATGLPRAVITEQVLAKHPTPPKDEEVVNAEDDDASRVELTPESDLLPEPKRVVKGTQDDES